MRSRIRVPFLLGTCQFGVLCSSSLSLGWCHLLPLWVGLATVFLIERGFIMWVSSSSSPSSSGYSSCAVGTLTFILMLINGSLLHIGLASAASSVSSSLLNTNAQIFPKYSPNTLNRWETLHRSLLYQAKFWFIFPYDLFLSSPTNWVSAISIFECPISLVTKTIDWW